MREYKDRKKRNGREMWNNKEEMGERVAITLLAPAPP
jgi:hypothetical protein